MSKTLFCLILAGLLTAGLAYVLTRADRETPASVGPSGTASDALLHRISELEGAIRDLGEKIDALKASRASFEPTAAGTSGENEAALVFARFEERMRQFELSLESRLATGSPELSEFDFAGEEGFVHADLLFDQGKLASAAYGYLTFVAEHSDHPDARDFWRKARDALWKAQSYSQAIAVQEQMMERFPEFQGYLGRFELALIERDAGRWRDAQRHMLEAADAALTDTDKAVALRHYAACVHRAEGDMAGLRAYQEALRQTEAMGLGENKDAYQMREQLAGIQRRLERKGR
jgi:tetratricopeptide (TPR) repeat protein